MTWTPGDAAQTVIDLLSSDWTAGNTGDRTPKFNQRDARKRLHPGSDDQIISYNSSSTPEVQGLPRGHMKSDDLCTIELMTVHSRAQILLMIKEVHRIMFANYSQPTSSPTGAQYDEILTGPMKWLQDYTDFWRVAIDFRCVEYFTAR